MDGHYCLRAVSNSGAAFQKIAKVGKITLDIAARASIYGLGYSFVEIREKSIGMDMRLWVLATPVDGTLIDLSLVSQIREIRKPNRWIAGLGFLPVRLRAPIMNRFISEFQRRDVLKDVVIWRSKQYRPRPRLCRSDGEIMPFRAYCAQFYPDPRNRGGFRFLTWERSYKGGPLAAALVGTAYTVRMSP